MKTNSLLRSKVRAWTRNALAGAAMAGAAAAQVATAQTLPAPGTESVKYDDFWSYSTRVLDYRQPGAGWSDAAGTGLLDVIITTRSSGQQNASPIPDPITNTNAAVIDQSWGGGTTADTRMLVSDLYNYLWTTFKATIPTFTFDQNETGGNPDLRVTAKVEIIDNFGSGPLLALWAIDGVENGGEGGAGANMGIYDPATIDPPGPTPPTVPGVTAPGQICVAPNLGDSGPQCFTNNVGSGKFDYIVYAPTMDLTAWKDDLDAIFKVSWVFHDVDDGGEEITLTGRFTGQTCVENPNDPACQTVPEPGTLALGGLALLGLWTVRRRRQQ